MKLMLLILFSLCFSQSVIAGPVRIGNGDDGEDLQSFELLSEGPIVEARAKALTLVRELGVNRIEGLGNLIPELEYTKLYMTKKGLTTRELLELGAFKDDASGLIYARTMPEPYAPTRFFPASQNLNETQLIALHIHEALHRALPGQLREREDVASEITQAITAPETSLDRVSRVVRSYAAPTQSPLLMSQAPAVVVPKKSRLHNPSRLGMEYRRFSVEETNKLNSLDIQGLYVLSSHLYPFGVNDKAIGVGFDLSMVETKNDRFMGPLSLSGRYQVWTQRDFDLELFGEFNMNTLSRDELKNSNLGRDTTRFGLTLATRRDWFFVENDFSYTAGSESEEELGNIKYNYEFGEILGINLRTGFHYKSVMIGGFGEVLLSDNFKIKSSDFVEETGRNRVISWGPFIEYRRSNFSLALKGRFLLDSSIGEDYDFLANLMGYGVGRGSIQTQINAFF